MIKTAILSALALAAVSGRLNCQDLHHVIGERKTELQENMFTPEIYAEKYDELHRLERNFQSDCKPQFCEDLTKEIREKEDAMEGQMFTPELHAEKLKEIEDSKEKHFQNCFFSCPELSQTVKFHQNELANNMYTMEILAEKQAYLEVLQGDLHSRCKSHHCEDLTKEINELKDELANNMFTPELFAEKNEQLANLQKDQSKKCVFTCKELTQIVREKQKFLEENMMTPELYAEKNIELKNLKKEQGLKCHPESAKCVVSGCNKEICASEEMMSICMAPAEPNCFQFASCEHRNGKCGWKDTWKSVACKATNNFMMKKRA